MNISNILPINNLSAHTRLVFALPDPVSGPRWALNDGRLASALGQRDGGQQQFDEKGYEADADTDAFLDR